MSTLQDDLRKIADVLETDSHYSGSDESKRRAGYAATLREHAAAMDAARPVAFLCGGMRFKLAATKQGAAFRSFPSELAGKWVALVDATHDQHLAHTVPPASEVVGAWQPIETAPKDGSAVLVMRDIWPGTVSGRAEECNGHNTYIAAWWGVERAGAGAWVCYMGFVSDPECPIEPTHWMPLPEPPRKPPAPPANLTGATNGSGEQGGG